MSVFFDLGAGLGKSTQVCASLGKSAVSTGASREASVDNEYACTLVILHVCTCMHSGQSKCTCYGESACMCSGHSTFALDRSKETLSCEYGRETLFL